MLELPPQPSLNVVVYSNEPDLLRPVFTAIPRVHVIFRPTGEYQAGPMNELVILDRFQPPRPPVSNAIWIQPPAGASPIPVRARLEGVPFERWCADNPLCAGLRAKDLRLAATYVFEAAPDDVKIGQVQNGPVIVARTLSDLLRQEPVPVPTQPGQPPQSRTPQPRITVVAEPRTRSVIVRARPTDFTLRGHSQVTDWLYEFRRGSDGRLSDLTVLTGESLSEYQRTELTSGLARGRSKLTRLDLREPASAIH